MSLRTLSLCLAAAFFALGVPMKGGSLVGAAGNYGGVLDPGSSADPSNSGLLDVQLKESGVFTAVLNWQGQRYPFKGQLDDSAVFTKTFSKKASDTAAELVVNLTLSTQNLTISGDLDERSGGSSVVFVRFNLDGSPPDPSLSALLESGTRVGFIDSPNSANSIRPAREREQSVTLEGAVNPSIPGEGFSVVTIKSNPKRRDARFAGRLPDYDGTFGAGGVLRGGRYSVFSPLYKRTRNFGGQLFGNANVLNNGSPSPALQAQLRWGKAAGFDSTYYPGNIDLGIFTDALGYPVVKKGGIVPIGTDESKQVNARVTFREGNISIDNGQGGFSETFNVTINITPFSVKVLGANPYQVKLRVDAFRAKFKGTFIHPTLNVKTPFEGAFQPALLPTPGEGRGSFRAILSPNTTPPPQGLQSGSVIMFVQ